ncbi:hypothetical protein CAEBREN_01559 [Caenorhabditis brenneri]|uniref:Uncharacterized protein n=1 Tax=Caenorhabditis brenneri TaxID=135651 RepID=G0MFH2_CAEBE|nr:hypothetical protein CAEBREN_01559 [Caenorhabditis brenneri]
MTDIFSDDDDFDAFRERLFDGPHEEKDEEFVPMFGLYALQRNPSSKPKPREDIFIRALEAPSSNDLDPYKDVIFEHKKPEFKADNFCENFSFFGMNQNRFRMEAPRLSREEQIAERNKLLEKARRMREEKEEQEDEEEEQDYSEEEEEQENLK